VISISHDANLRKPIQKQSIEEIKQYGKDAMQEIQRAPRK
jgi:hypothetical protein